jgi:hypothetical protein
MVTPGMSGGAAEEDGKTMDYVLPSQIAVFIENNAIM